jgi:transcriptional antiterminator NusG
MIEANLVEIPHIIKSITSVIGFFRNQGGEPVPLRMSEVNRMLGKVDELAVNEILVLFLNIEKQGC